ncbi:MAG: alkaline phosphatase [Candidatus Riflebacteria bacterium]|nr:alkaline phosphatase [Candidatus Riflebacteria bacterium]
MSKFKNTVSIIILIFGVFFTSVASANGCQPKNIIYLIGDGMGVAQITAARFEKGPLNFERFKILGLHMTSSNNNEVTDSAAAGTALATGHLTNNGVVGLSPDGEPVKNLMEYAREKGKATGIVVTATLAHATPAAFSSHVKSRYHYDDIALQQAKAGFDVMVGGGSSNLYPKSFPGSRRRDEVHVLDIMRNAMPVVFKFEHLEKVRGNRFSAIFSKGHMPLASERNFTLGQLVEKAIETLNKKKDGFVLMVEGSQIDLRGHANDSKGIISETLDFDTAIKAALDFAERDGNTLVVVTADHETSGLALDNKKTFKNGKVVAPHFASDDHTASMVPVFAYGPGAEIFGGVYKINELGKKVIDFVR